MKFHDHHYANGGDPMKRSLVNQLSSYMMMAMLLNNNLVTPFFTWRLLIGPLYSGNIDFSLAGNTSINSRVALLKKNQEL